MLGKARIALITVAVGFSLLGTACGSGVPEFTHTGPVVVDDSEYHPEVGKGSTCVTKVSLANGEKATVYTKRQHCFFKENSTINLENGQYKVN